ncbi:Fructosamine-3-kinase [Parapedobacter composti]|uniref:Fructosamine-3-kinase n=1 Tax=Parapedobacter composti TaxID=623281 RepID=A0A1I1KEF8_9SPHI|nr:fructosamine kinase family protein [Parapedobacter composti]SFC55860.1 Fructosamine-3-kinase [Parapedobacter composti]
MVFSESLLHTVETAIKDVSPHDFRIQAIRPVAGGDINRSYQLRTKQGCYFAKVNDAPQAMPMFLAELRGLKLLHGAVPRGHIAEPVSVGQAHGEAFLLLAWVDTGNKHSDAGQEALGRLLAQLHRRHASAYGLDHSNFIGRLPQDNTPSADWAAFFIGQRLQKQLQLAKHYLNGTGLLDQFASLFDRLPDRYPYEPPSLLHGDLWGGNYLVNTAGQPVLIDPAVYHGHREVDIAMTKLFGGFSSRFYAAYHEAYPLQPDWEERIDLWNLYPLLVHLNLFGPSYIQPIKRSLNNILGA